MFLSVVLWLSVPVLALAGYFLPRKATSDVLADMTAYACAVLSLVCAVGGFLALGYGPTQSTVGSYGSGQETGFVWRFGIAIVVLAVLANWTSNRLLSRGRGKQDDRTVKTSSFALALDAKGHSVTITTPDAVRADKALAGRLLLSLTPTGDRVRVRLFEVTLPHYLHEKWCGFELSEGAMRPLLDTTATPGDARALDRWYTRHEKTLAPNETRARTEWDADCAALLRTCRDQRTGRGTPAMEAWAFLPGPDIRYLAIEPDGALFTASGDIPHLTRTDGRLQAFGNRIRVLTTGGPLMTLTMDREQVGALHRLQAEGRVLVEQAPAPLAA